MVLSDLSDHLPIYVTYGSTEPKHKNPITITCRPIHDDQLNNIIDAVNTTDWNVLHSLGVDEATNFFINELSRTIDRYAPEKTIHIRQKHVLRQPWVTPGLLTSSRTRDKLYKKVSAKTVIIRPM